MNSHSTEDCNFVKQARKEKTKPTYVNKKRVHVKQKGHSQKKNFSKAELRAEIQNMLREEQAQYATESTSQKNSESEVDMEPENQSQSVNSDNSGFDSNEEVAVADLQLMDDIMRSDSP